MNVDVGFKDSSTALVILARNDMGKVQGLWLDRGSFLVAMEVEAKSIYNACSIVRGESYLKIIIENDCKVVLDATLGFWS